MINHNLLPAIDSFLNQPPYYACLLLVHPEIARLRATEQLVVAHYGWPTFSVGTVLSQLLIPVNLKQRPRQTARDFMQAVKSFEAGPIFCADIDLLFEPALSLEPLRLFRDASRHKPLVVAWPGTFDKGVLAYATGQHAHYKSWSQTELCDYCLISL